jgi:hypothetical protein
METTQAPPTDEPCSDCDLGAIEDLACNVKRFQRQAEVASESLTALTEARTKFATARADYQAARDAARGDVRTAKTQLADVLETLRCKIDDQDEDCVEKAVKKVVARIRECTGKPQCCSGPGDFDKTWDGSQPLSALAARIAQYRQDVGVSMDCFTALIQEQADLPARAAAIKAEVASIASDLAADDPDKDLARLYARALVARWHLKPKQLWKGYATVNDYVDCLCQSLTNAMTGWEAIAILEGIKAELDCKAEAAATACAKLQTDIVAEVYAEYIRCCPPDGPDGSGGSDDSDSDCDCGHHHGKSEGQGSTAS